MKNGAKKETEKADGKSVTFVTFSEIITFRINKKKR
jgi:hypothetical protein